MIDWKAALLPTYYQATRPFRWWWNHCLARDGRAPLCVLVYHRIADDRANGWTTSTRDFLRQVNWLQRNFELISLPEVQQRMREPNRRPAIAITFDDG